jgi:hypothetical protein
MSTSPHPDVADIVAAHRFSRFLGKGALPRALDDEGRRLCGWCRSPLDRRSIGWCSDDCADEFWVRTSHTYVLALVHRRDIGVCSMCGLDTQKLLRIVDRVRKRSERYYLGSGGYREPTDADAGRWERLRGELAKRGYGNADHGYTPSLWEADHIIPVVEGGGCCGLENYRTLCIPCHRVQTRKLRARTRRTRFCSK